MSHTVGRLAVGFAQVVDQDRTRVHDLLLLERHGSLLLSRSSVHFGRVGQLLLRYRSQAAGVGVLGAGISTLELGAVSEGNAYSLALKMV